MSANSSTALRGGTHWRRVTRHPAFAEYRRLNLIVALINLFVLVDGWRQGRWLAGGAYLLQPIADMALINLGVAILVRQQRFINALFWLATRIPTSWPLWIRWVRARCSTSAGCIRAAPSRARSGSPSWCWPWWPTGSKGRRRRRT